MKRSWIALLIACWLLPACALAFDVSPYRMPITGEDCWDMALVLLSGDEYWQRNHVPTPEHYEQGRCTFSLPLADAKAGRYTPVRHGDGVRLIRRQERNIAWMHDYTLHEIEGSAIGPWRSFEGSPYDLLAYGGGFLGAAPLGEAQSEILLYDEHAQLLDRCDIPFPRAVVQGVTQSGGAGYALICQHGSPSVRDLFVLRIADGALARIHHRDDVRFNRILPDGQGGVLLCGTPDSDYKLERICQIHEGGSPGYEKTLTVKRAIAQTDCAVENPDGTLTLYGAGVAASRDLYTAFALTLDGEGRILSIDARDLRVDGARIQDTEPDIRIAENGEALVYLRPMIEYEDVHALVPFADLPAANDPGVTLK